MADPMIADVCPVEAEFLGIPIGTCERPITHEVAFVCDGGCKREPRRVCEFHALLLSKDDPSAYCGQCADNRIHPAGSRVLEGGASHG